MSIPAPGKTFSIHNGDKNSSTPKSVSRASLLIHKEGYGGNLHKSSSLISKSFAVSWTTFTSLEPLPQKKKKSFSE